MLSMAQGTAGCQVLPEVQGCSFREVAVICHHKKVTRRLREAPGKDPVWLLGWVGVCWERIQKQDGGATCEVSS